MTTAELKTLNIGDKLIYHNGKLVATVTGEPRAMYLGEIIVPLSIGTSLSTMSPHTKPKSCPSLWNRI